MYILYTNLLEYESNFLHYMYTLAQYNFQRFVVIKYSQYKVNKPAFDIIYATISITKQ